MPSEPVIDELSVAVEVGRVVGPAVLEPLRVVDAAEPVPTTDTRTVVDPPELGMAEICVEDDEAVLWT